MAEEWKAIRGFEGLYSVSDCGSVRNDRTRKRLKWAVSDHGYCSVKLFREKKGYQKAVHRLVAEAFIPNPENKPQVNHKDLNKRNNYAVNLEWVTNGENMSHAIRNGANKTRNSKLRMNEKYRMGLYQMTCLFQPSLNELLDELALKTGKSKSEMVREAAWEYVYKHTADKED